MKSKQTKYIGGWRVGGGRTTNMSALYSNNKYELRRKLAAIVRGNTQGRADSGTWHIWELVAPEIWQIVARGTIGPAKRRCLDI